MIAALTGIGLFLGIAGAMVYVAGVAYFIFALFVLGFHEIEGFSDVAVKLLYTAFWPALPVIDWFRNKF